MTNLLELAEKATEKNLVKVRKTTGMNDSLVELLYNQKLKLTRSQIHTRVSLMRLQDEMNDEITKEIFQSEEVQKRFKQINTTVKNAFDSSWCKGQNNASFHYNPNFKSYKLECIGDLYQITKVK